ncbi:MAG: PIG-L family deacetylase [Desulfobacterales bacterium]|nr:PIG-L family deacetylase [Deltaproteobacteria bacterium]NNK96630.1 PIG-L family deacetylase [Desulfobacterales bacterium]
MNTTYNIMIVIAHPDDAEFGAAGSVAQWTAEGKSVVYVVCTNGDKGTSDRTMSPQELSRIRQEEQRNAARVLGVGDVVFLDMVDQQLEETPAFREAIVRLIRRFKPEIVLSSDPYRRYVWHRDHRIVGQVVMDALFPYARDHMAYPDMLDEGLEPHKVKEVLFFGTEAVNHHIDISNTFSLKLSALECHASQVKEFKVADMETWLKKRCQRMAEGSEYTLAEAFHRVRMPD